MRKELTPVSSDVFISIPERAWEGAPYRLLTYPTYQVPIGSDIFDWLNNSETYWLDSRFRFGYGRAIRVINSFVLSQKAKDVHQEENKRGLTSRYPLRLSMALGGDELATKVGWRFGATIKEARYQGHTIETDNEGKKWKYRLLKA